MVLLLHCPLCSCDQPTYCLIREMHLAITGSLQHQGYRGQVKLLPAPLLVVLLLSGCQQCSRQCCWLS
jgi:hypothetical protein